MSETSEEIVVILLHEIIDDIFPNKSENENKNIEEASKSSKNPNPISTPIIEIDDNPPILTPTPTIELIDDNPPILTPINMKTKTNYLVKRLGKRLGVNPRAHEQIVSLQKTLAIVTKERDFYLRKYKEVDQKLQQLRQEMFATQDEMQQLVNWKRKRSNNDIHLLENEH